MQVVSGIRRATLVALVALAMPALAWEPTRTVGITVPAGAGVATDQMARVIQSTSPSTS